MSGIYEAILHHTRPVSEDFDILYEKTKLIILIKNIKIFSGYGR
jgi:hypothetical protein